jgi:hypothetical protein
MEQELIKNCVSCPHIILHPAWSAGECWLVVHLDRLIDFNFQLQSKMAFSKHHPCPVCERKSGGE